MIQDGVLRVLERHDSGAGEPQDRDAEHELTNDEIRTKFKRFIKEFHAGVADSTIQNLGTLKYREALVQNCSAGYYTLQLNIGHLGQFEDCEKLRESIVKRPSKVLPICEGALKELYEELVGIDHEARPAGKDGRPDIQLQLQVDIDTDNSFGTLKPLKLRDLDAARVENMVVIKGICTKAEKPRHKSHRVFLKCRNCGNSKEIEVPPGYSAAHIPSACDGNPGGGPMEKCPPKPFIVIPEDCQSHDEQTLKIQELPEDVPVGEMPRSVVAVVCKYIAAQCVPGSRVTAVGVFVATEKESGEKVKSGRMKGISTVKFSYLHVLGMEIGQGADTTNVLSLTPEQEERMEALAKDPQIRDKIYRSIAPAICTSEKDVLDDVKKAVALMLFGGSRKPLPDGTKMRGDINVLLFGDPGTAKSQFLKFAERVAPIAVYTSGKGSSAAGLTAAIVKGPTGFAVEGGAMVLADGGIVCIDEFDKMRNDDRVAIHEAMEQQTISIAKAGITTVLNTRCSVLAAANPTMGSYSDLMATKDQMDFETTILSRFDMIFRVRDVRDENRDFNICKFVIDLHRGRAETPATQAPLEIKELRRYLSYCRGKVAPRLSVEAAETLQNTYIEMRRKLRQEKADGNAPPIPITVRQLEAIIRMSEALAKMELKEECDIQHVEEALRLFNAATMDFTKADAGLDGRIGLSDQMRQDLHAAQEQIRRRVARDSRIGRNTLLQHLNEGGVELAVARRAMLEMIRSGELEERGQFTLHRPR